jgi:hypothetical protein
MLRRAVLVMAMMALGAVFAPLARAQDPAGCVGNAMQMAIFKDRTYIRDGETVNYTVKVRNDDPTGCTVSAVNVRLQLPSASGAPSNVFQLLGPPNANWPVPTAQITYGAFPYTVSLGTTPPPRYTARVSIANAALHDIQPPYSNLDIDRTLQTYWVQPSLTIAKVGSTTGGPAPQTVTYTYSVRNTTTVPPPEPATGAPSIPLDNPATSIANVAPADNLCAPLQYASGDTNGDGQLQQSETWVYTCKSTFANAGTYTNTATVCGDNVIDKISKHYCSPPATWTVNVTPPKGAVKGASAGSPKRCVTLPSTRLKVRARELSTVRVRVRVNGKNVARSLVHVRGAGVRKTGRTNKHGMVTFHVRPKKTGRLRISSDQCGIAARLSVKPARQVVSPALPEVTG